MPASCVRLRLLGRFAVAVDGSSLSVSRTGQRLLARLALNEGVEDRGVLAGALWPEHAGARAQANLRGAVWRLPAALHRRLRLGAGMLAFDDGWDVDLHASERLAGAAAPDLSRRPDGLPASSVFRHDLLPDWDEPWLLLHRERYRQLRLHALENLARQHLDANRPFDAADCALLAIASEPLRESAQRLLVRSHLAAGNRAAALASYERFRRLLADELGVVPGPELTDLVRGVGHVRPADGDHRNHAAMPPR
ncbi:AfsR/SARP family transcriptional regulator [Actinopolymorpha singaporensis]|uniref:AfsR/SARP family transcriptional regulator n=1 Tax=Actinopolymorpha singaporensis TaxID=117157 RepID=UPI0012FDAE2E|nr:BTAD domain-containing putative transcriptional regulator [Actinopolymorpha singaporensis]